MDVLAVLIWLAVILVFFHYRSCAKQQYSANNPARDSQN